MGYNIISGISQQHYHIIQPDIDLISTSPKRKSIFQSLSQIGYDKFPEFILDILVKIEGHTSIDVTDGQGDEKQDILTISPNGKRCLTQCKHTIDYKSHYNGDDLDLLVAACMRKNCQMSIFVTNSDLTPQGKKYVNDNEYSRGWRGNPDDCPTVEYWNGYRIWEKIKNNQDIINKWFSGLGQVHGVRNFKFDITIQQLPYLNKKNTENPFDRIVSLLKSKDWIEEIEEDLFYKAKISDKYVVNIKQWFQFTSDLKINIIIPNDDIDFINKPQYAFTIEVIIDDSIEKYSPQNIRNEIIHKISEAFPDASTEQSWWHIICGPLKTFVYIHDISEPREIELVEASTFVSVDSIGCFYEIDFCSLSKDDFISSDDEDDTIWIDKATGIQIIQLFEQKIHPVEQYNHQIRQYNDLKVYASYTFYAVEKIDSSMLMRVRRMLNNSWIALKHNDNNLIWGIPPDDDEKEIDLIHRKINAIGVRVLNVKPEDVNSILEKVQVDIVPSNWMYHSEIRQLSFPVMMTKRVFWLSQDLRIKNKLSEEKVIELLQFKYGFENQYGFDNLLGKENQQINTLEINAILYDIMTFRGKRMLDISLNNNPISINLRFKEGKINSSNDLVKFYINEFEKIYKEIDDLLNL